MKALLVIDLQIGVCNQGGQKLWQLPVLIHLVNQRINQYRAQDLPIIFIQHEDDTLVAGTTDWQLLPELNFMKDDLVIRKSHPNAFYQTDLQYFLKQLQINELEICGAQTEYCIDATVKMAHGLGYQLTMKPGASSTIDNQFMTAEETRRYFEWLWGKNFLSYC